MFPDIRLSDDHDDYDDHVGDGLLPFQSISLDMSQVDKFVVASTNAKLPNVINMYIYHFCTDVEEDKDRRGDGENGSGVCFGKLRPQNIGGFAANWEGKPTLDKTRDKSRQIAFATKQNVNAGVHNLY